MPVRRFPGRFLAVAGVAAALAVAAVLAVLGGLFLSAGALIAIGVVSLAVGCLTWGKVRETEPARRRIQPGEAGLMAAAGAGVGVLAVSGLVVLAGAPTAILITGLLVSAAVCAALVRTGRVRLRRRPAASTAHAAGRPVVTVAPLRPVSTLTTEALGREWLLSTSVLGTLVDVATRQSIVRRRQDLLDELERRNPAGFALWLADGRPGSDPAPYLSGPAVGDEHGGPAADTDAA